MKLDKKFTGGIIKVKDGAVVPSDEWIVFLAKDSIFARYALPAYRQGCIDEGCDETQIAMVDEMIANVATWRSSNPTRCKLPDAAGEKRLS